MLFYKSRRVRMDQVTKTRMRRRRQQRWSLPATAVHSSELGGGGGGGWYPSVFRVPDLLLDGD